MIALGRDMGVSQAIERIDFRRAPFNTSVYVLATFLSAVPAFLLGWDGAALDVGRLRRADDPA